MTQELLRLRQRVEDGHLQDRVPLRRALDETFGDLPIHGRVVSEIVCRGEPAYFERIRQPLSEIIEHVREALAVCSEGLVSVKARIPQVAAGGREERAPIPPKLAERLLHRYATVALGIRQDHQRALDALAEHCILHLDADGRPLTNQAFTGPAGISQKTLVDQFARATYAFLGLERSVRALIGRMGLEREDREFAVSLIRQVRKRITELIAVLEPTNFRRTFRQYAEQTSHGTIELRD